MKDLNLSDDKDHEEQVKKDLEKIKKLVVTKQIDMLYGGGFLVFDSNFDIKQLIYTAFKDGNTPVFSSQIVNPNTENNAINSILQSEMAKYNSLDVSSEILQIIRA